MPLHLTIHDYEIPSRNKTRRMHWAARAEVEHMARILTLAATPPDIDPFDMQVDIHITAYRERLLDGDNVDVKGIIDGLKGRVLVDDSRKYVRHVITDCQKGFPPYVEIQITEVENDVDRTWKH